MSVITTYEGRLFEIDPINPKRIEKINVEYLAGARNIELAEAADFWITNAAFMNGFETHKVSALLHEIALRFVKLHKVVE